MGINIKTPGVHPARLRSADCRRSKQFYTETLGFPIALEQPGLLIILAGNTAVGIRAPVGGTPKGDRFNPLRVGLDHLAIACQDEAELGRVAKALTQAGIENTGVKKDETLGKRYVAFKDPDRIAWELYMA